MTSRILSAALIMFPFLSFAQDRVAPSDSVNVQRQQPRSPATSPRRNPASPARSAPRSKTTPPLKNGEANARAKKEIEDLTKMKVSPSDTIFDFEFVPAPGKEKITTTPSQAPACGRAAADQKERFKELKENAIGETSPPTVKGTFRFGKETSLPGEFLLSAPGAFTTELGIAQIDAQGTLRIQTAKMIADDTSESFGRFRAEVKQFPKDTAAVGTEKVIPVAKAKFRLELDIAKQSSEDQPTCFYELTLSDAAIKLTPRSVTTQTTDVTTPNANSTDTQTQTTQQDTSSGQPADAASPTPTPTPTPPPSPTPTPDPSAEEAAQQASVPAVPAEPKEKGCQAGEPNAALMVALLLLGLGATRNRKNRSFLRQ
jgi:hypothetical protein